MNLRTRLIVFFAALASLLMLAEWFLVESLTERLHEERRQDAIEIGEAILEQFGISTEFPESGMFKMEGGFVLPENGGGAFLQSAPFDPEVFMAQINAHENADVRSFLPIGPDSVTIQTFSSKNVDAQGRPIALPFPVALPGEESDIRLQDFRSRLLLGTGAILLFSLLVGAFGAHRLAEPLRGLARSARKLESGQFGTTVPEIRGGGEVGEVVSAFNSMSVKLEEFQQETDRLREQTHLNELGELASGLAHAMRNPLNVLGLSVQRLASGKDGAERREELASSAQAQIQRVDHALRNFMALSNSGHGPLTEIRLKDLCHDVALELMQSAQAGPAVKIETNDPKLSLLGVSAELRALIHVLVVNAAEASQPDDEVRIRLSPIEGGGRRIEVLDRGCGLDPEQKERLFSPHFTTKQQGAGLGLYLAQRIASSRYRGSLQLENREGGGCVAILDLHAPKEVQSV